MSLPPLIALIIELLESLHADQSLSVEQRNTARIAASALSTLAVERPPLVVDLIALRELNDVLHSTSTNTHLSRRLRGVARAVWGEFRKLETIEHHAVVLTTNLDLLGNETVEKALKSPCR